MYLLEIYDSLNDQNLENQLHQAARVLESQINFEIKPVWHGPYFVYPQVKHMSFHFPHMYRVDFYEA